MEIWGFFPFSILALQTGPLVILLPTHQGSMEGPLAPAAYTPHSRPLWPPRLLILVQRHGVGQL